MIRVFLKKIIYAVFNTLSKLKTNFFSETFIAFGYLIKNASYYRQSTAVEYLNGRFDLHKLLSSQFIFADQEILYMEFGVRWGTTINSWASDNINKNSSFWGFDTFTGIPEDWGNVKAGSFSMEGEVPGVQDSRVVFHVGLVQDTLPKLLKEFDNSRRLVMHFDFDLYSATLFTMLALQPFFKKGDVLIFDEFFSISKNHHEFRAFKDYLSLHKFYYKPIYKIRSGQYVIELL